MLHGLRNEKRVVISTMADGATGQPSAYRDLWGTFIVNLGDFILFSDFIVNLGDFRAFIVDRSVM